jgi:hypothetical protein
MNKITISSRQESGAEAGRAIFLRLPGDLNQTTALHAIRSAKDREFSNFPKHAG